MSDGLMTDTTLQDMLLRAATDTDAGITFISNGGADVRVDYPRFVEEIMVRLGSFQAEGMEAGDEMLLFIEDNRSFLCAFWACIMGGGIPIPVSVGRTGEHIRKLARVWKNLASPRLVTDQFREGLTFLEGGDGIDLQILLERTCFLGAPVAGVSRGRRHPARPGDIAFVQFSSGSTGSPKGVTLTHANIIANLDAIIVAASMTRKDVALSWMPLTHDMGLIGFHLAVLKAGVSHALMPTQLFIRRPSLWMEKAEETGATLLSSPNFGYRYFLRSMATSRARTWNLSSVRLIFNGAEQISPALCAEFSAVLAKHGLKPNTMFPVYGLAEACLAATFPPPGRELRTIRLVHGQTGIGLRIRRAVDDDGAEYAFVGRPLQGCELRVANSEDIPLADGILGNIQITGANVTGGYYLNSTATSAAFTADGWFRTGDLGFRLDGEVVITGRVTEMISVFGRKIHAVDIERIAEKHAGRALGRITAFGIFDREEQTESFCIAAVFKGGLEEFQPIAAAITRGIRAEMGVVPNCVLPLMRIPTTTSGKVMRFKLSEMYGAGEMDDIIAGLRKSFSERAMETEIEAASELEARIRGICESALAIPSLGIHESLVAAVGESLKLVRLQAALEREFPGRIKLSDFFEYQTISGLAAHLSLSDAYSWDYFPPIGTGLVAQPDNTEKAFPEGWLDTEILASLRMLGARTQANETDVLIGLFAFVVSRAAQRTTLSLHIVDYAELELYPCRIDFNTLGGFLSLFRHVADQRRAARLTALPLASVFEIPCSRPTGAIAPMVWINGTSHRAAELKQRSGAVLKLSQGELGLQASLDCDSESLPSGTREAWLEGFMSAVQQAVNKPIEHAAQAAI